MYTHLAVLLTLTTTYRPATDLGYLLHKRPSRVQAFELSFGKAHVFYPEVGDDRCTAALLLDVDPVGLVRGRERFSAEQYVNDRPYVASSFLSVAIARVFGSALAGRCDDRPELASRAIPLVASIATLPCRGGEAILGRLFEPLGYGVKSVPHLLDEKNPDWGRSRYLTVALEAEKPLSELLNHLYVLMPVLDDGKHYWVGQDEVEKLLRRGEGWLGSHPDRELIAYRYLRHQPGLARQALARLLEEDQPDPDTATEERGQEEAKLEERLNLNDQRIGAVLAALRQAGARKVIDLGCGEGRLLRALVQDRSFERIVGMDVSYRALEIARDRLHLDRLPEKQRERIALMHGSLLYRDRRLEGFEAATAVEVIEHLDPPRLAAFERVVFEFAKPPTAIVTTPNAEYNVRFEQLPGGHFRHKDHRFEWTRQEFQGWASRVAERFGYRARFLPVGADDRDVGPPTQMAVFSK